MALTPEHPFIGAVLGELREAYGPRLVAAAIFGSVARRTARPDSDLDLFLVVEGLPRGRRARFAEFRTIRGRLRGEIDALAASGVTTDVRPVLRTPDELQTHTPLMLDLTEDAVLLEDRGGVLAAALDDLRTRLQRLGSRRVWDGEGWYWDLKPDYKRGEIVEI
jgi:predicted nucleotidyltransferase